MVCPGPAVYIGQPLEPLTITSGDTINWWVTGPHAKSVISFPNAPCSVEFGARYDGVISTTGCTFFLPGTYQYSIEGFGAGSGTVTVLPPPLQVIPRTVVFGDSTVVSGQLPTRPECYGGGGIGQDWEPPDRQGTLFAQSVPLSQVTAVGARGDFALLVTPSIGTTYQARLDSLSTVTASVQVRPRIELFHLTHRRFLVRAFAARSLEGAQVEIRIQGRTIRTLRLDSSGAATLSLRGHGRMRAFISAAEAGSGYIAGFSNTITL